MPVLPSPAPLAIHAPPSLATEPVGGILAGSIRQGDPTRHANIVGYILVRLIEDTPARWFSLEATYDGATSYADAVNDLQFARGADAGGAYRRLMPVYAGGTAT